MKNNIRVNDIPLNERPIEKLLQFGVNTLSHFTVRFAPSSMLL